MGRNKKAAGAEDQPFDYRKDYYWGRVRHYGKRYKNFHWPSVELLLSLIHVYDVIYKHFAKRFSQYGLSPSTFNVLMILIHSGGKAYKQNDLSKLLFVSRANITGLIDSLVRQGLVMREADPKDRRAWLAKITAKGEELVERFLPSHYAEMARVTAGIGSEQKRIMIAGFFEMLSTILPKQTKNKK